jgi:hypothetical protein
VAFGQSNPLERADVAAAEDGRTPLNTYGHQAYNTWRFPRKSSLPRALTRQTRRFTPWTTKRRHIAIVLLATSRKRSPSYFGDTTLGPSTAGNTTR